MHKLIALEGIDGSGTTTQTERLAQRFDLYATKEPSDGPIGRLLRSILTGRERLEDERAMALLFAADRLHHVGHEIEQALRSRSVITDRYVLSSIAYQSQEVDRGFVAEINRFARPPDLTILIEVDAAVAETRRLGRGDAPERYDERQKQRRIADAYRAEATRFGAAVVDGNGSAAEVFARLVPLVQKCLE